MIDLQPLTDEALTRLYEKVQDEMIIRELLVNEYEGAELLVEEIG